MMFKKLKQNIVNQRCNVATFSLREGKFYSYKIYIKYYPPLNFSYGILVLINSFKEELARTNNIVIY